MTEKQNVSGIRKCPHHDRHELCSTRPSYRQGKKLTAVKVYTVNEESQHLIIRGVPALNLHKELKHLCMRYGDVKLVHSVSNYAEDEEAFTEVYHAHFVRIQAARFAKRMIDDKAFFGGILHVCYAPELESLSETRHKLAQRICDVRKRVKRNTTTMQKHFTQMNSHYKVSQQEASTSTLSACGVVEQVFVRRNRTRNHVTRRTEIEARVADLGNHPEYQCIPISAKRNYATQFIPSSLKKRRSDPKS